MTADEKYFPKLNKYYFFCRNKKLFMVYFVVNILQRNNEL